MAKTLEVPLSNIFGCTDSHITLGWLQGNPWRFLVFVGNQVAKISEVIQVACWHHVKGTNNPAIFASMGMFPAEFMEHDLCKKGSQWLKENEEEWNEKVSFDEHPVLSKERDIQQTSLPVIIPDLTLSERISNYHHLLWIIASILRFVSNASKKGERNNCPILSL